MYFNKQSNVTCSGDVMVSFSQSTIESVDLEQVVCRNAFN